MSASVVMRADATPEIGAGHVMRCLAVGEALIERGCTTHLAAAALSPNLADRLRGAGIHVHGLDGPPGSAAEGEALRRLAARLDATVILIDHYGLDEGYRTALRASGRWRLAVFDDLAALGNLHADVVINASLDATSLPYGSIAPQARLLLGPRYAPLRREFRDALAAVRLPVEMRTSIFLSFGGSDPLGLTAPCVERLLPCLADGVRLTVVVGGMSPGVQTLRAMAACAPERVDLHVDSTSVAALMGKAGLAVAAAGTTTAELAAMGVPSVLVTVADNQSRAANAVEGTGWCQLVDGRSPNAVACIGALVQTLWASPTQRRTMAMAAARLTDGGGALRIADALLDG